MFRVGDVVHYGQDKRTRYVIIRIHTHMNNDFEYDGESLSGSSFSFAYESELTMASDQDINSADKAYDRAMAGL